MSRKRNLRPAKLQGHSKFIGVLSKWLKFVGLLVPIAALVLGILNYELDRQKFSDNVNVIVSTEYNLDAVGEPARVSPPESLSITSLKELFCGSTLIVSNTGAAQASLVGYSGSLSLGKPSDSIAFESQGNDAFLSQNTNALPKGLSTLSVRMLNGSPWFLSSKPYLETDTLAFPVDIPPNSSLKIRVAITLNYETEADARVAIGNIDTNPQSQERKSKLMLQLFTSTAKQTQPIEFNCFEGVIFGIPTPSP